MSRDEFELTHRLWSATRSMNVRASPRYSDSDGTSADRLAKNETAIAFQPRNGHEIEIGAVKTSGILAVVRSCDHRVPCLRCRRPTRDTDRHEISVVLA